MSYQKLPDDVISPIASYYTYIKWDLLSKWNVVRFDTPMDGSCLFHAIMNSFFEPYHRERIRDKRMLRQELVKLLRLELSECLTLPVDPTKSSITHYQSLNHGNTVAFAEAVPEFKLSYMQKQLNSYNPIGYGYMEFIGNILDKDIYILEGKRKDIYVTDELPLTINGNRKSIILFYISGHYELVGIENNDGTYSTHFSPNHSLIQHLKKRVNEIISD